MKFTEINDQIARCCRAVDLSLERFGIYPNESDIWAVYSDLSLDPYLAREKLAIELTQRLPDSNIYVGDVFIISDPRELLLSPEMLKLTSTK